MHFNIIPYNTNPHFYIDRICIHVESTYMYISIYTPHVFGTGWQEWTSQLVLYLVRIYLPIESCSKWKISLALTLPLSLHTHTQTHSYQEIKWDHNNLCSHDSRVSLNVKQTSTFPPTDFSLKKTKMQLLKCAFVTNHNI